MSTVTQSLRLTSTTRSPRPLAFGSSGATRTTASRTTSPSFVTIFGFEGLGFGFSNALISAFRSGVIALSVRALRSPEQSGRLDQRLVAVRASSLQAIRSCQSALVARKGWAYPIRLAELRHFVAPELSRQGPCLRPLLSSRRLPTGAFSYLPSDQIAGL